MRAVRRAGHECAGGGRTSVLGVAALATCLSLMPCWIRSAAPQGGQEDPAPAQDSPAAKAQAADALAADALEQSVIESIAACESSVVAIARVRKRENRPQLEGTFPGAPPGPTDPGFVPNEYAAGVVIDSQGLILTTYHALGDPEENDYYVWLNRTPFEAVPVEMAQAADPWMDLAVLKVAATNLTPIKFGDAARLRKGQIVIALGNPQGIARDGEVSASWGIVSNLARKAPAVAQEGDITGGRETLHHYGTLIQTDAKLNFGTSGGALINRRGEMVGLITALAAGPTYDEAAGFAIPVDENFKRALEVLKDGRRADYGFLGVLPWTLSTAQRQQGQRGARVRDVVPGTPAARAELQPDDIILAVNEVPIYDDSDLIRQVSAMLAEATAELQVQRGNRVLTIPVVLSKKQLQTARRPYAQQPDPTWQGMRVEYATAMPAFYQYSRVLDPRGCVGVAEVEQNSPAWQSGLRAGDFINQVGPHPVRTPSEFHTAVRKLTGPLNLSVSRNGEAITVRFVEVQRGGRE